MALLMAERTDLADALDRWLKRQRLQMATLERLSGLSRRTLYNIRNGDAVTSETLRKVAHGLATDPHTRELDRLAYAESLKELFAAGGVEVPTEVVTLNFDDELMRRLQNRATASEMRELLDRWPNLSTAKRAAIEATIRAALED